MDYGLKISELFDLNFTQAADLFKGFVYPWEVLGGIKDFIINYGATLKKDEYDEVSPQVWVHKTATVAPTAMLCPPCVIGAETEVRHCAFIRGSAFVGRGCVVGNSTELKNVILFDGVQCPHYNYVGDGILGHGAHMGAGSITSNVKSDKTPVKIKYADKAVDTGLKKLGAMIGDFAEIGCNSVLNPGTVIGRNATVYPLSCVRGAVPANSIYKSGANIAAKK